MNEIWRDCPNWEKFYEISSFGNVKSKKRFVKTNFGISVRGGKILKQITHSTGYLCVNLTGNGIRKQELIHRLVLFAFHGEVPNGYQACHKNGIRSDCHIDNLRWDTVVNNHADKHRHGTAQIGSKNPYAKLKENQAKIIKYSNKPLKELAKEFNVSFGCVEKIRYRQSWKHL